MLERDPDAFVAVLRHHAGDMRVQTEPTLVTGEKAPRGTDDVSVDLGERSVAACVEGGDDGLIGHHARHPPDAVKQSPSGLASGAIRHGGDAHDDDASCDAHCWWLLGCAGQVRRSDPWGRCTAHRRTHSHGHPTLRKYGAMPLQVTVVDHPVAQEALTHLRDQDTSNQMFRAEMRRLSLVVVAEATRRIPTRSRKVTTPLATTDGVALANRPVLVPILRAGLGMLPAAMELLPDADIAVVGVQRDEETHEPTEYVAKLPHDLSGRTCVVLDPMLATGGSLAHGCKILVDRGAKGPIYVACVLAAPEGIKHLESTGMDLHVVTASIDSHLNERAFIVPGLGDAGDRQFGPPN